ncbi:phospholipase A2, group V, isoform CRA_b [Rattus norvegicus]|uniref:Phospholipase A2, group V, isoform CRA_b n=1 Tax=Rattus norvegicus TaxID=10116 RepID=A6ITI8_RAT|nr:phospholipase A2, group V, isoform CRA_b [Rattus norvegicus]
MLGLPAINVGIQTLSTEAAHRDRPWEEELRPG